MRGPSLKILCAVSGIPCEWVTAILRGDQAFFFFNLFYIGVEMINNVVLVSDVQQSDSVVHLPVSILSQMISPFTSLQNIEQSSLFPYWLSI